MEEGEKYERANNYFNTGQGAAPAHSFGSYLDSLAIGSSLEDYSERPHAVDHLP